MATSHRPADIGELVDVLGVHLAPPLLERALTHRSFAYEHGNPPTNERLEFLGDAVLSLVVTDALYHRYPDEPEGTLAKMRASVVNGRALADVARTLGVGDHLLLGKGEQTSGGRNKSSILADTVEALIGATYVQHGIDVATAFVHRLVDPLMSIDPGPALDWKTALQELTAKLGLGVPEYVVTEEGPDHDKTFHASVLVQGVVRGKGSGKSKKEAEQVAARTAYEALEDGVRGGDQAGSESDEPPAA